MIRKAVWVAPLATLAMVAAANGGMIWQEVGDAGDLPTTYQDPTGSGPLTGITGEISPLPTDADLYNIRIVDVAAFSASTLGSPINTQLWLFYKPPQTANGITFNDNDPWLGSGSGQAVIFGRDSATGAQLLPGPGDYLLGISISDRDAADAAGMEIWADEPTGEERGPDGPGAPGPLAGWVGNPISGAGPYTIELIGVEFKPEPATIAMLALGGLPMLRRRR